MTPKPTISTKPLTPGQRRYLEQMRRLQADGRQFSHRSMCNELGFKSVASSWNAMQRLLELGFIVMKDRAVTRPQPTLTPYGLTELEAA